MFISRMHVSFKSMSSSIASVPLFDIISALNLLNLLNFQLNFHHQGFEIGDEFLSYGVFSNFSKYR